MASRGLRFDVHDEQLRRRFAVVSPCGGPSDRIGFQRVCTGEDHGAANHSLGARSRIGACRLSLRRLCRRSPAIRRARRAARLRAIPGRPHTRQSQRTSRSDSVRRAGLSALRESTCRSVPPHQGGLHRHGQTVLCVSHISAQQGGCSGRNPSRAAFRRRAISLSWQACFSNSQNGLPITERRMCGKVWPRWPATPD